VQRMGGVKSERRRKGSANERVREADSSFQIYVKDVEVDSFE
jgi:hypothetical protein